MSVFGEYLFIFVAGGLCYGGMELLFRGHTHWTMLLAGGICSVLLLFLAVRNSVSLLKKCILGGTAITVVEFFTGLLVNLRLGWNVWDYSGHPLNVLGQICPLFMALWAGLSLPVLQGFRALDRAVSKSGR